MSGLKIPNLVGAAHALDQLAPFREEMIRTNALLAAVETGMMMVQAGEIPWKSEEILDQADIYVEYIMKKVSYS